MLKNTQIPMNDGMPNGAHENAKQISDAACEMLTAFREPLLPMLERR